ncbi:MAG TPA: tetratricopeptide repeat protein [Terriglobales bacterium]|nr:tetratricopeptide repeat protein [Terriglobales bacterium]
MNRKLWMIVALVCASSFFCLPALGQKGGGKTGGSASPSVPTTPTTIPQTRQPRPQMNRPYIIEGVVRMEDGAQVSRRVTIERVCSGSPIREAYTDSSGYFSFQAGQNLAMIQEASVDSAMLPDMPGPPGASNGPFGNPGGSYTSLNPGAGPGISAETLMLCGIRAALPGYRSDEVQLADKVHDFMINVGTIVLHPMVKSEGSVISVTSLKAPKAAKKAVENGRKNGLKEKYPEALADFQKAVQMDPNYAEAWFYLAETQVHLKNSAEAEQEYQKAVEADSRYVPPYMGLAQLAAVRTDWQQLASITDKLLALDPYSYPVAYLYNAAAYFNLQRDDLAERSAVRLKKLDSQHKLPRINLLLAQIMVAKKEYAAAAEELRTFLKFSPAGKDAEMARGQLEQIEKASGQAQAQPARPQK